MATLWFSYSIGSHSPDSGEPLGSPYTIAWHVGNYLRRCAKEINYNFEYVNLDDTTPRSFTPRDIAVGHTWWDGGFMHQALSADIKAKFILQPYSAGMVSPGDVGMVLNLFNKADHLFLITGEYWYSTMPDSPFAALYPKVSRLDMAVSADKHPCLKSRWQKAGERAVCVIGHDTPTKGYQNVAELARVAGFRLGHFGSSDGTSFEHVPCMTLHNGAVFTPDVIQWVCDHYDAVMALPGLYGADACPTVLLEAASWGLAVFCDIHAGYLPGQPFRELRLDDMAFNVAQIRNWQHEDEYSLTLRSQALRKIVEQNYNWQKMCSAIWQKVSEFL